MKDCIKESDFSTPSKGCGDRKVFREHLRAIQRERPDTLKGKLQSGQRK